MGKLIVKNISNADDEFLKVFYREINELDIKLINLINSKNLKIIIADKLSNVLSNDKNDIEKTQDYHPLDRDIVTRGLCSDTINAICIFYNNTTVQNVGAILYHEIGHLIDYYDTWGDDNCHPKLSKNTKFIETYNFCIKKHWDKIKNDNRFRLKHYIQSSYPDNASTAGLMETFAHCFARINNKFDDIDILGEYFTELLPVSKCLYNRFLY